jgi:hypothetical protein
MQGQLWAVTDSTTVRAFFRLDSGAVESTCHALLFPEHSVHPELFAHVPPPLPAAPPHARPLPDARFAALWTALDLTTTSHEWQLRLIAVAATCLWLAPAQCCEIVGDLVAQHGWEPAEEAGIQVPVSQIFDL